MLALSSPMAWLAWLASSASSAFAPVAWAADVGDAFHPPVLQTKVLVTNEDAQLAGTIEATDVDGDTLTFKVLTQPRRARLKLDAKTGAFTLSPPANWHGEDAFTVEVTDGKHRAAGSVAVTVAPVDDPPAFSPAGSPRQLAGNEDATVRGKVTATDVDGEAITYAITGAPAQGVATIDATTGALMYIPAQDFAGDVELTAEASAGGAKASLLVRVTITPVNDKPVADAATFAGTEDTPLEGTLSAKDVEGDTLSFKLATPPKKGKVVIAAQTGAFTYTPYKDANGADAFTFDASDGKLKGTATVSLTLAPVDDPPLASPLALSGTEDATARGKVSATDVDGDTLAYALAAPPAHGEAKVDAATGALTYTPAKDYSGADAFTVEATAGGAKVVADVKVQVAPANDAPTAAAVSFSVEEDGKLEGALAGTDIDGDALTYKIVEPTKRGLIGVDAAKGSFVYRPARDKNGDDAFTFEVSDGKLRATSTAAIKISAVDDPPAARPLTLATAEDTAGRGQVAAVDVDGDALTYALGRAPANGTATVDASTGAVTFTPAADFAGGDSFGVEVTATSAGAGGAATKVSAEVSVQVSPVNDAPIAVAGSGSGDEDVKLDGALSAADPDGDKITFKVAVATKRGVIAVDAATGAYVYRPAADFHGEDAFTFEASDGKLRSSAIVKLVVRPVDDPPTARPLALGGSEDAPARGKVDAKDGDGDALRFSVSQGPAHGSATVDAATGAVLYTPAADYAGDDAFTVEVASGEGAANGKASAAVTVKVAPVNDAPVARAASFSVEEDGAVEGQLAADDVEGDALTFKIAAPPKRGSLTLDERTGALRYRPYSNAHGADSFTFEASDGRMKSTGAVQLAVSPVNDAPVARAMALTGREDTPLKATMGASDIDGDKLAFAVARVPARGSVVIDERTGTFTYTPAPDEHGEDSFTLSVGDGAAAAEPVVNVSIASVPDAPRVREGVVVEVAEDGVWSGPLPAASPDGGALTFRLTGAPRLGGVVLADAANGAVKYTPRPDANGEDDVAFEVFPAGATSAASRVKGSLKVRVTPVNDVPTLAPVEIAGSEDTLAEAPLVGVDADGDRLTFAVSTPPALGKAAIQGATVRYEPLKDHAGDVTFEVVARDGGATSIPVKVTVHLGPVNDPPVLSDLVMPSTPEDTPAEGVVAWTDVDKDRLAFKLLKKPARGIVDIFDAANGRFRYTPERNFAGPDTFVLVATDAGNAEGRATVRVMVTPVDDAPIASAAQAMVPRVGRFRGKLSGYDPEGSKITFAIERGPAFGRVELLDTETGEYVLVTDGSGSGNTFFRFTVHDGKLTSAPSRVDLTVR